MSREPEIRLFSGDDHGFPLEEVLATLDSGQIVLLEFRGTSVRGEPFRGDRLIIPVLSRISGLPPEGIILERNPWGKPALQNGLSRSPLQFNLSHSGTLAVLALYRGGAVGVDVEEMVPRSDPGRLVRRFFAPGEQAWFFSPEMEDLEASARLEQYYRLWSRKEAVVKALGKGLGFGLAKFEASPPSEEWREITAQTGHRLLVRNLTGFSGWAAGIALALA